MRTFAILGAAAFLSIAIPSRADDRTTVTMIATPTTTTSVSTWPEAKTNGLVLGVAGLTILTAGTLMALSQVQVMCMWGCPTFDVGIGAAGGVMIGTGTIAAVVGFVLFATHHAERARPLAALATF